MDQESAPLIMATKSSTDSPPKLAPASPTTLELAKCMAGPMFNDDEEVKRALESCLNSIDQHGAFATAGTAQDFINPGLHIDGLGRFGLPLSHAEVKRLIDCSRQAPFGKGNETIVDTSVRNTWEIDASRIQLQHPKWRQQELRILASVCNQMGIPGGSQNVEAHLYKLLVYEKDAMFKPHKDTEKAPRMFGTLVVCLPCEHEGGNLVVSFNGKTLSFESAPSSEWSCSYFSWYGDVLHEVKPVASGYRIVLTYNLVHTGHSALPDLVEQAERSSALRSTLTRWATSWDMMGEREDDGWVPDHLVYMLDHEYTEANLRLDHLKGYDRKRVGAIVGLLEDTDMACYLCTVEKKVHGAVPGMCEDPWGEDDDEEDDIHEIDEVYEEDFSISLVFELDGTLLGSDFALEVENMVQPNWFDGRSPDEEDFGGWTGNEGASTTHWYRDAALVIMPRDYALTFLLEGATSHEVRCMIQREANELDADPSNEAQRDYVLQLCRRAKSKCYDDESMALYTRVFLSLGRMDLFIDHVASGQKQLPPQILVQLSTSMSNYGFENIRTSVEAAAAQYRTIGARSEFLHALSANFQPRNDEEKAHYGTWKEHQIDALLAELGAITAADAPSLVALACERGDRGWVSEKLLPLIRHSGTSLGFALSTGNAVLPVIKNGELDHEVAVALFREAASPAITRHNLDHKGYSHVSFCLTHTDLINLHRILLQLGMRAEEDLLLERLENVSASAEFGTFNDVVLPYVRSLMQLVKDKIIPMPSDRHHGTFQLVFRRYIECLVPHNILKSGDLITVHRLLLELHLVAEADMLMQRLQARCGSLNATALEYVLLPYVQDLILKLKVNRAPLDSGSHCGMIRALLRQYTLKCLPMEPTPPRLQLRALGCGCLECRHLDRFLLDPRQKVYHLKEVQKVRNHLRDRIEQEAGLTSAVQKGKHGELRVTKRNGEYEHQQWKDALLEKRRSVLSIASSNDLKLLLGDQYSQIIQSLEPRKDPPMSTTAMSKDALLSLHLELLGGTPTELEAFMGKIRHESAGAKDSFLTNSLLPYLRDLVPLMKQRGIALNSEDYRNLFRGILSQYTTRVVGPEPSQAMAWAQKKRGCGCADCRELDTFLISSSQQIGRFTMNQERREHLQERLGVREGYGHADLDYTGHTERPEHRRMYQSFTLVVTKKPMVVGVAHEEWTRRCAVAKKLLSSLAATQDLRLLLGDGYNEIMDLARTKPSFPASQLAPRTPLAPKAVNSSGHGPVEHIDGKARVSAAKTGEKRRSDTSIGEEERSAKRSATTQVIDLSSSPGLQSM